jgi:hypothetical protein
MNGRKKGRIEGTLISPDDYIWVISFIHFPPSTLTFHTLHMPHATTLEKKKVSLPCCSYCDLVIRGFSLLSASRVNRKIERGQWTGKALLLCKSNCT